MSKNELNVNHYPYGKVFKSLENAVSWLKDNKRKITKDISHGLKPSIFDFPDYWNMPKRISSKLRPDEVDWIQSQTYQWEIKAEKLRKTAHRRKPKIKNADHEKAAYVALAIFESEKCMPGENIDAFNLALAYCEAISTVKQLYDALGAASKRLDKISKGIKPVMSYLETSKKKSSKK